MQPLTKLWPSLAQDVVSAANLLQGQNTLKQILGRDCLLSMTQHKNTISGSGNPRAALSWSWVGYWGGVKHICPLSRLYPKHLLERRREPGLAGPSVWSLWPFSQSACTCPRFQSPKLLQSNFLLCCLPLPLWRSGTPGYCQGSRTRLWQASA